MQYLCFYSSNWTLKTTGDNYVTQTGTTIYGPSTYRSYHLCCSNNYFLLIGGPMFWIISVVIFIIPTIYYVKKEWNAEEASLICVSCIIITVVSILFIFVQSIIGVMNYPSLTNQLGQINALQNRVQDIKDANYAYEKNGNFVAGSIENYKQSTNLSLFIKELAEKEATYRGYLQKCKTYKEVFPLYFFGPGWAISKNIYKLPEN